MSLGFNTNILGTIDMSATGASDPIYIGFQSAYCVHAIFDGATSPVGSITLEASIDGSNWSTVADSSSSVSAAGTAFWDVTKASYPMVRVKYTRTSGSGTMTIKAFTKD